MSIQTTIIFLYIKNVFFIVFFIGVCCFPLVFDEFAGDWPFQRMANLAVGFHCFLLFLILNLLCWLSDLFQSIARTWNKWKCVWNWNICLNICFNIDGVDFYPKWCIKKLPEISIPTEKHQLRTCLFWYNDGW